MTPESYASLALGVQVATLIVVINAAIKVGALATKVDAMWQVYTRQHRVTDAQ